MTEEQTESDKDYKAKWQREWRKNSGKTGAAFYFTRTEIDVIDWLALRMMDENKTSPAVVGRPAVIRALLQDVMDEHADEIAAWAIVAPEPAQRGTHFKKEIGRRRRGLDYEKYKHLSREQQQALSRRIRRAALAQVKDEERHELEAALMHEKTRDDDPD